MITTKHETVVPIDVARTRQLNHLLDLRSTLSRIAAERRSHGLPDAVDYDLELLRVEGLIADGWPQLYSEKFTGWIEQEHEAEHPTGVLTDGCGICQAIAQNAGVNLRQPAAS